MSSVVISGDTSGTVSLTVPAVAGTNTATLPAATGTIQVSGNQPAFRVSLSATQTISTGVATKVAFDTEAFDTNSCFDTSTYRFTPNVAGYYQFNSVIGGSNASVLNYNFIEIYKNGVPDSIAIYGAYGASFVTSYGNISSLVYMNGSTDYVEMYVTISGGAGTSTVVGGQPYYSIFSGSLVRAA